MNIKDQFPIFKNNPELVYLDSSATSQKPQRVIDSLINFYSKYNSNVHRGIYPLSEKATTMYEDARKTIAKFINAEPEEIIFTSGTTDGINAIADSLIRSGMLNPEPKILTSDSEHHSSLLPWQRLNYEKIDYLTPKKNFNFEKDGGYFLLPEYANSYDVVALSLVSNVTGVIYPIEDIFRETENSYRILDAAQAVAHMPIDVKNLNSDFIVFSGHKMYGPTGVGVIWGKKELLEKMEPFRVGGGMISEVTRESATWAPLPEKFEAGTPPIADAIAMAEAANFLSELGFERIQEHEEELRKYLIENLQKIEGIKIYHPDPSEKAVGVVSITVDRVHPHDLAQYLGEQNICVRAGHHCTQILHREVLQIPASLRISLGVYNTNEDIDKLVGALKEGIEAFQK